MSGRIKIRSAEPRDLMNIFKLSSDDEVRRYSKKKRAFSLSEHIIWFDERVKKKWFFVIENINDDFIGQVRVDDENGKNVISISIVDKYRAVGYGKKIITEVVRKLPLNEITAYIHFSNVGSIYAFKSAGFTYVDKFNEYFVYHYVMRKICL